MRAPRSAEPGNARSTPRSVVRRAATVTRIWSRLARPTASASRSARSDSSRSRRSTCRAPVTWSSMAASVCPARSWSSRAMRRRSSATAWSASDRRAASSCRISARCCLRIRPRTNISAAPDDQGIHSISSSGASSVATTQGLTTARTRIAVARTLESRCQAAYSVTSTSRKKATSRFPARPIAKLTSSATGMTNTSAGGPATNARATRTAAASATAASSTAVPGSLHCAAATMTTALTTTNGRSDRCIGHSGRRRSSANLTTRLLPLPRPASRAGTGPGSRSPPPRRPPAATTR